MNGLIAITLLRDGVGGGLVDVDDHPSGTAAAAAAAADVRRGGRTWLLYTAVCRRIT